VCRRLRQGRENGSGERGFCNYRVREGVAREIARGWERVIYGNEKGEKGIGNGCRQGNPGKRKELKGK
jgi:hypothetical protein